LNYSYIAIYLHLIAICRTTKDKKKQKFIFLAKCPSIANPRIINTFAKRSNSRFKKKKKYDEKATKNREKRKVLLEKYKQTPQYKEWMQKRKEWLRSVKVFYPPKPRKDSNNYEEEMRAWHRACRRLKLSAKEGRLEGSKWITMYLRRKELEQEARERRKIKKKEKGRKNRRLKRNKLAAIKKKVKNVKVKTGKKGKKKGAKKLNQSKNGNTKYKKRKIR